MKGQCGADAQWQIWASNEDLEHLINALTHVEPFHLNSSDGPPLLNHREGDELPVNP